MFGENESVREVWARVAGGGKVGARDDLEEVFRKNGFNDFRWIDPKRIAVSNWVRMKCMYGCPTYGRNASCPPNTPSVSECERFFREYKEAAVFHFEKTVAKREDCSPWAKEVNLSLLKLENQVFLSGYRKAFSLFIEECTICKECTGRRETCREPKASRPTAEAFAVDTYATVSQIGYPIHVLKDYSEKMNRYAFLMID